MKIKLVMFEANRLRISETWQNESHTESEGRLRRNAIIGINIVNNERISEYNFMFYPCGPMHMFAKFEMQMIIHQRMQKLDDMRNNRCRHKYKLILPNHEESFLI